MMFYKPDIDDCIPGVWVRLVDSVVKVQYSYYKKNILYKLIYILCLI